MGNVQQAVLEFDEEVRAPWRPRLVPVPDVADRAEVAAEATLRPLVTRSPRRSPSRVGACRPGSPDVRGAGVLRPAPRRSAPTASSAATRSVPGAGRPRPVAPLRLTRRARRLAVVLALAAGVALGSWLAPLVSGGSGDLRLAGEASVVVQSGDTLWSIASSLGTEADVRAVVDEIQRLNHLDGADLVPGQVLQLP